MDHHRPERDFDQDKDPTSPRKDRGLKSDPAAKLPPLDFKAIAERHDLARMIQSYGLTSVSNKYLCPFHQDTTPSMGLMPDNQHYKCWSCGAMGDVIDFVARMDGISKAKAARKLGPLAGTPCEIGAPSTAKRKPKGSDSLEKAFRSFERSKFGSEKKARYVSHFTYFNADGSESLVVARFEVTTPKGLDKTFRPFCRDDEGLWRWGDPAGLLPLYRLADLGGAERVFVLEGERIADLAAGIGLVATTSAHGAKSAHKADWSPLAGKQLVILPDADEAGAAYAKSVRDLAAKLSPPASVVVVELPGLGDGEDFAEWLERLPDGWDDADARRELERLVDQVANSTAGVGGGGNPPDPPGPESRSGLSGEPIPEPNESDEDPHRLARIYINERCTHTDGLTLVFHKGEFHRWNGAYQVLLDKSVRAELSSSAKREFDRINVRAIANQEGSRKLPKVSRVTTGLINNVALALSGYTLLGGHVEPPAWLSKPPRWPAAEMLPATNGLLHLPTFASGKPAMIPPTPRFFCPYNIGYDFEPKAPPPRIWHEFLSKLWPDDVESCEALQEWFGYHLTPDVSHQKIGTIIGPKRSGKGTIARVLTAMIGKSNVCNPTLSGLGTQFGTAVLIGKLAAIVTDARISGRSDIAQVVENLLSISGEDGKTIARKHLPDWDGKLMTKFTIISNETPRLADSSGALSGRMIILKLTRSFYGKEDRRLFDKLTLELPGILLWAIEGWKRLSDRGHFFQPSSGHPLVEEMEELSSPIGTFVRDCCEVGDGKEIDVEVLFGGWKDWCQRMNREHAGDLPAFGRNLRTVIPTLTTKPVKRGGKYHRVFGGIDLIPSGF